MFVPFLWKRTVGRREVKDGEDHTFFPCMRNGLEENQTEEKGWHYAQSTAS